MPPMIRRRRATTKKPTRAARISKGMAKAIKQIVVKVEGKSERKYVAEQLQKAVQVDTYIALPGDAVTVLPPLLQGSGSFQRDGQLVSNISGATHFNFSLPYNYAASSNWVVRLYMLQAKAIRSATNLVSLIAGTLLDPGNGTTKDWDPTVDQVVELSQTALSRENYTGSYRDFKLSKNSGSLNGDASTPPPSPNGGHFATNHQFTWKWKHQGALKYDENSQYPTNYAPFFILVAFPYDNFGVTKEPSPVIATIRTEMYYTDT